MNKSDALVVFSGGQDSTTCLFWAKKHFRKVYALSFIYGQKHVKEVELARAIAGKAGVEFKAMDVSFIGNLGKNSLPEYWSFPARYRHKKYSYPDQNPDSVFCNFCNFEDLWIL